MEMGAQVFDLSGGFEDLSKAYIKSQHVESFALCRNSRLVLIALILRLYKGSTLAAAGQDFGLPRAFAFCYKR
jgi:hypothetical protein